MIQEFTGWNRLNPVIQNLLKLLPGEKKLGFQAGSVPPLDLICQLEKYKNYDTILLTNGDVWRHGKDQQLLNYFDQRPSTQFYIQHLGYHNVRQLDNVCELSFNTFYFLRILTESNLKKTPQLGFGCLNRMPRFHRTWLAYQLWKHDAINNVVFSIKDITEGTSHLQTKLQSQPAWAEFEKSIPIHYPGTDLGDINDHSVKHVAYSTFCNIVTESETEWFGFDSVCPTPVVTEKTWKPFLSCQIPIFYAAQGQLQYLKEFGFEVFENVLPNGYDNMGTIDKAQAIVDIVSRGKEWISDIYFANLHKIKHNHELIISDKVEKMMFDSVRDFVYN